MLSKFMRWFPLILLSIAPDVFAQGDHFQTNASFVGNIQGTPVLRPLQTGYVSICLVSGSACNAATIYSDQALTVPMSNPILLDKTGNFGFWAAPGYYKYAVCSSPTGCTTFDTYLASVGPPGPPLNVTGAWSSTITYSVGQVVTYNNGLYLSNISGNLNYQPDTSPTQWATIALPGGIQTTPGGAQTIAQPGATTLNVNSLNNVLEATQFTGSDIGAKINAAIYARGTACGTITVAPGSYTLSTTVSKPRCIALKGDNVVITSTITGNRAAFVLGTELGSDTSLYQVGEFSGFKIIGPGSSSAGTVGVWVGGDPNGVYASTTVNDFQENIHDINVQGFEAGIKTGISYQDYFAASMLSGNKYGMWVQGIFGSENMQLVGMQMNNNGTYGFYAPNMPASEFTCVSCSIDYNGIGASGQAGIYVMNGKLDLIGGHMEQCGGYFIDGPVTTSAAMVVNISNMTFVSIGTGTVQPGGCPAFTTPDPGYIHVTGQNSSVNIGKGIFLVRNHDVNVLVDWAGTGSSETLHVDPYFDPVSTPGIRAVLPSIVSSIASIDLPIYDQFVSKSQYFKGVTVGSAQAGAFPGTGAIFADGIIGTDINLGGVTPTVSGLPFGGNFMGWNATNNGDADFFSPAPSASSTNDAYGFYVNYGSGFVKIASFGRDGSLIAFGADFKKGDIQIGAPGAASSVFTFAAAPTGSCTTGDIGMNRSGTPNSLYVCQSGAWVGK